MKSWGNGLAAFTLACGGACLAASIYVLNRGFDPSLTVGVTDAGEVTNALVTQPTPLAPASEPSDALPVRPDGLRELTVVPPELILLEDQRSGVLRHLRDVGLTLNLPDAMSYRGRREGRVMVLSGASGPGTGFFLFSARGRATPLRNARKFLRAYFAGVIEPQFDSPDQRFLSRFAGELTWIRGTGVGGQRFDAFEIPARARGFAHLIFIFDPTVANATRRLMIDSIKPLR